MASSLRMGLETALTFSRDVDAALFSLCDQPELESRHLIQLVDTFLSSDHAVVASTYDGHLGAPTLIQRTHFSALAHLTGDEGARRLIKSLPPSAVATVDAPELAWDIDTPDDLRRVSDR